MKLVNNYAKIILEKSSRDDNVKSTTMELAAIKDAIFSDKKITRFFTSPINKSKKKIILQKITDKYRITPIVVNVLKHMIKSGSLEFLPNVVETYRNLSENQKAMKVIVSEKPTKSTLVHIEKLLEEKFGRNLNITYIIDPNIIGGMVVRYGNLLLDASIKGNLPQSFYQ